MTTFDIKERNFIHFYSGDVPCFDFKAFNLYFSIDFTHLEYMYSTTNKLLDPENCYEGDISGIIIPSWTTFIKFDEGKMELSLTRDILHGISLEFKRGHAIDITYTLTSEQAERCSELFDQMITKAIENNPAVHSTSVDNNYKPRGQCMRYKVFKHIFDCTKE